MRGAVLFTCASRITGGAKLPVNIGQNNFDTLRYDMYRDETVSLEALKAGEYDFREENIARSWATGYDCPALKDGRLKKEPGAQFCPSGHAGVCLQSAARQIRRPPCA